MCKVLAFDVICDKKEEADTLMEGFASLGMNVSLEWQTMILGAGKWNLGPPKQEGVFRVSVDIYVDNEDIKAGEKRFVAAYKDVMRKNDLKLSGEYIMHPAFYGVAFPSER